MEMKKQLDVFKKYVATFVISSLFLSSKHL